MELEDGPRTAGASGRGGDLRGRCAIAGLLRTAAGGLRRALYPLTWGSGTRRRRHDGPNRGMARGCSSSLAPRCWRHAGKGAALTCFVASTRARSADRAAAVADADFFLAGAGGDGARGWTSHRRGERPRRRPTGSLRDRRAVAHSGWGSQACSLSVDVGQRHAASPPRWPQPRHGKGVLELTRATLLAPRWKRGRVDLLCRLYARAKRRPRRSCRRRRFLFGRRRRRWSSRMDLAPPGRAAAAATYGVAARSPGCCAQRLGVSGVLSIR